MIYIAIIIAMIGVLRLEGRRWWCKCGRRTAWTSDVTSGCNSQHLADWYSLTHIEHGLLLWTAASLIGIPSADRLAAVILIEAIWECIENSPWAIERYRAVTISRGYYGD